MCKNVYYKFIVYPENYIFGVLFVILAFLSALGNTVAIVILQQPELKSIRNRIVTSLCCVACCSGFLYLPILAWNLFNADSSVLCHLEIPRSIVIMIINITSILNLAILTHDRCILLTRGTGCNQSARSVRTIIMIILSWAIPAAIILILYVLNPSYKETIKAVLLFIPLPIGVLLWMVLKYMIRKKEKELNMYVKRVSDAGLQTRKTMEDTASRQRHLKLGKIANLVMYIAIIILLPLAIGDIFYIAVSMEIFTNSRALEVYYLIALLIANSMACIHLVIYYKKYPEFKRTLLNFWKVKKLYIDNCT